MFKNLVIAILSIGVLGLALINSRLLVRLQETNELHRVVLDYQNKNFALEIAINGLEHDFSIYQEQLPVLKVLQDAGIKVENIYDLRELIAEGDKLPYGSPFNGGHYITSAYGERNEVAVGGRANGFHNGVDLYPKGRDKSVYTTADGEIIEHGFDEFLGKYIIFETTTGHRLRYGHLKTIFWQDVATKAVNGIKIQKGTKIGIVGDTGKWVTGLHLHLEIYKFINSEWVLLDPEVIIDYIGRDKE